MASAAADPVVREVEDAFVAHWSLLGHWPGGRLVDDGGALRFETSLRKLPYNGVIRTAIERRADEVVTRVVEGYAARRSEFFWLVHPSARPRDLGETLAAAGLKPVETASGMSLDLAAWRPRQSASPPGVEFAEVVDEDGLRAYASIVDTYWQLDDEADRDQAAGFNRYWSGSRARGRRWLAFLDGRPVGKGYLSLAGPPGVAAIYGMSVLPEARGMGVAGGLTDVLLQQAKTLGSRRAVLHSSEMAAGVYRRAGFVDRCPLTFFAIAPIWSAGH